MIKRNMKTLTRIAVSALGVATGLALWVAVCHTEWVAALGNRLLRLVRPRRHIEPARGDARAPPTSASAPEPPPGDLPGPQPPEERGDDSRESEAPGESKADGA